MESGMELPLSAQAARCLSRFQNKDALSFSGQVSGADQSVMPCADDDRVKVRQSHVSFFSLRTTRLPIGRSEHKDYYKIMHASHETWLDEFKTAYQRLTHSHQADCLPPPWLDNAVNTAG